MKKNLFIIMLTVLSVSMISSCGEQEDALKEQVSKLQSENEELTAKTIELQKNNEYLQEQNDYLSSNISLLTEQNTEVEKNEVVEDDSKLIGGKSDIELSELALSFANLTYDEITTIHARGDGEKLLELGQWEKNALISNSPEEGVNACVSNIIIGDKAVALQNLAANKISYDITNSTLVCIEVVSALSNDFSLTNDSQLPRITLLAINENGDDSSKKTQNFSTGSNSEGTDLLLTKPEAGKVGYQLKFFEMPLDTQEFDILFKGYMNDKSYNCAYYHINVADYK